MRRKRGPDLENYLEGRCHRFVNYAQGARIYRLPYWSFVRVSKEAQSNYPIRKTCIVDLIPANIELSGLEVLLTNVMSRENIMKEYLDVVKKAYDYVIMLSIPWRVITAWQ